MRRVEQVAEVCQHELAGLIYKDLDNNYGLVTLTNFEVTSDFKDAKAYISCFDQTYQDKVLKLLNQLALKYQHILGRSLKMKFTPKIKFLPETGLDNVTKVEQLLNKVKTAK